MNTCAMAHMGACGRDKGGGAAEPHQARCLGAQLSAGSLGSHGVRGSLAPCRLGVAIPCIILC